MTNILFILNGPPYGDEYRQALSEDHEPNGVSRGYWRASPLKTGANALRLIAQAFCDRFSDRAKFFDLDVQDHSPASKGAFVMSKFNLAVVMTVAFALPISLSSGAEPTKDSLETVRNNVEQGKAVLVDVREESEWERGHIKDCVLLPMSDLRAGISKKQLAEKLPEKKILYTYCVVGQRAATAGGILEKADYEVRPLKPGYRDLLKAGFENATE